MQSIRKAKERQGRNKGGWQRRTLPPRYQGSTIRARELNCRVRYGTGCTLTALATNNLRLSPVRSSLTGENRRSLASRIQCAVLTHSFFVCYCSWFALLCSANTRLLRQSTYFPVSHLQKPSTISTGWLQTLLSLHLRPIKLVVFQRSYFLIEMGSLILRSVSHLDAFSGYQLRSLLLGYATGVTTDSQALRPPRSSRTRGSSPQTPNAHSG